ncbi:MAG: CPBP family intramembrane metalloprotease [Omnitrophica bacterium]|nr:CPBP family intramembrane metalloprotease [Candidatus Omnitrophota bacterium]
MLKILNIPRLRKAINRERIYTLMLAFIILVNAWIIFAQNIPAMKETFLAKRVFKLQLSEGLKEELQDEALPDEKTLWTKVLKERGNLLFFLNLAGFLAVLVFSLGLFLDIRILLAKLKNREIIQVKGRHAQVKWNIGDIFKLAIIFVFIGYIIHIIEVSFFSSSLSEEKNNLSFISLLNTGIMDLALLGFIVYFVKVKYSQNLAAIGLKIKGATKTIFLAVLSYIAFLPILIFILLLLVLLAAVFDYQPPQQTLFKVFLREERTGFLIYATMMIVILGPIVEEVFFRGFAYTAIRKKWGILRARAITAVVFAGLHGTLIGFLPITALGFLLAYMYEKTGSLISSITIHILHNGLMLSFLFLVRYLIQLA